MGREGVSAVVPCQGAQGRIAVGDGAWLPPSTCSPSNNQTHQVCKYIDMPLQHIDNLVLLSMNRPPRDHTVSLLNKLRERIPDLALRTTFISGG